MSSLRTVLTRNKAFLLAAIIYYGIAWELFEFTYVVWLSMPDQPPSTSALLWQLPIIERVLTGAELTGLIFALLLLSRRSTRPIGLGLIVGAFVTLVQYIYWAQHVLQEAAKVHL